MASPPIPIKRLEQIASDACNSALSSAEFYEHAKTEQWNQTIIDNLLKALISESTPSGAPSPSYKFAVNSTIVQHVVPNSQVGKPTGGKPIKAEEDSKAAAAATATDKGQAGRRGMHSSMRAYWNEKTDGMWSYKYDGEGKGLDVVIMVIWVGI